VRLLFVLPEYPPDHGGGIATVYGALLPELVRLGHDVHAVVGSAYVSGRASFEDHGVTVSYLEPERYHRLLPAYSRYAAMPVLQRHLAAARAMWEQTDGGAGFDRVEVVEWGLLFAPWICAESPPSLVRLHGSSGQISEYDTMPGEEGAEQVIRIIETALLPHAAALSTSSRINAAYWEERLGRQTAIVPPPLPPSAPLSTKGQGTTAFVAGRLQEWKGPRVLADALRLLGDGAPVVEWAGRAVMQPRTGVAYDRYLATEYADIWNRKLIHLGQISPAEVQRRQREAKLVIIPSLWDVYNLTAVEAMARGSLVVCSDGAGAADIMEDGVNGFVFRAGDARALADATLRALDLSSSERKAIIMSAAETVREQLDPARIAALVSAELIQATAVGHAPVSLTGAVAPGEVVPKDAHLARLPLRDLIVHAAGRIRTKLSQSIRS